MNPYKTKVKIRRSDMLFSRFIRTRDNWTCQRCRKPFPEKAQNLHCSHFWGRSNKTTRWDPMNCDALCYSCHMHFESNRKEYEEWKHEQLGKEAYNRLMVHAHSTGSDDEMAAREYVKKIIKEYEEETGNKVNTA